MASLNGSVSTATLASSALDQNGVGQRNRFRYPVATMLYLRIRDLPKPKVHISPQTKAVAPKLSLGDFLLIPQLKFESHSSDLNDVSRGKFPRALDRLAVHFGNSTGPADVV